MHSGHKRVAIGLAALALLAVVGTIVWIERQLPRADASFAPAPRPPLAQGVEPAPIVGGPRVAIDAAHHDGGRMLGLYAPLSKVVARDGFTVVENTQPFSAASLATIRVLVIADALGARWSFLPRASSPAFTDGEEQALDAWVRNGGSLLLVADAAPAGLAAARLARRFGVDMRGGRVFDPAHADPSGRATSWIAFRREDNGVRSHPVTDGGDPDRRVRRAVAFTGQSLGVPAGATALLDLAPTARERLPDGRDVGAAGRAMAVAVWHGQGRVVVVGESAMLTALLSGDGLRFGMGWPGADDERFAVNAVRWLAGVPR
jgi:hypothetical protein